MDSLLYMSFVGPKIGLNLLRMAKRFFDKIVHEDR